MKQELDILNRISQIKGKGSNKIQQEILAENLNEDLKYLLDIAFNPFVTTKLNKIKVIGGDRNHKCDIAELKELLNPLLERKSANNEIRENIGRWLGSLDLNDRQLDILVKIITKNLVIGIKSKTINSAVGYEMIPNPSLMLAKDKPEEIDKWSHFWCEVKYDGIRLITVVANNDIKFYSRNFNEVNADCLSRIRSDIKKLVKNDLNKNIFFDGELTDFDRKSVSGKFNKILKDTAPEDIDKDFIYNIFDIESTETLTSSKGHFFYSERRMILDTLFFDCKDELSKHTILGESEIVNSKKEVLEIYDSIVEKGGEGVICKCEHLYETKRSSNWVKFKQIRDCDLEVIDYQPGEGKRTGYIGSLICITSDKKLKVKVGSGFTDLELEEMNKRIKDGNLIGKIATIKYNEKIFDKHGNHSLFLPRFVTIREDKTTADTFDDVK